MRAPRIWLAFLATTLLACGSSADGDDAGGGDAASAGNGDAGSSDQSSDGSATAMGESAASQDAGLDGRSGGGVDAADTDTSDSSATCTGAPQPIQATCVAYLNDSGAPSAPSLCLELTGSTFGVAGEAKADCDVLGGVLTSEPCPTASVVGKCIGSCGQASESVLYAYASTCSCTAASLEQSCTAMGGFFLP
jgi:hypothetical protein